MKTRNAWRGLASALLASACAAPFATGAFAQDGPKAASPPNDSALSEVIVTAQHRKENAQTVPISITSVTGKALEQTGYESLSDLQHTVAGLQYDPTNGTTFQIRGVGTTSFDFSTEKSVNTSIDDVAMDGPRDIGLIGLEDIASVDVLKGPQGTLFGKNATSGAISVTTAAPSLTGFSAHVNLSDGTRDDHVDNFALNIPLNGFVALRLTGFDDGQVGKGEYTTLRRRL